jgi:hypothetical protein
MSSKRIFGIDENEDLIMTSLRNVNFDPSDTANDAPRSNAAQNVDQEPEVRIIDPSSRSLNQRQQQQTEFSVERAGTSSQQSRGEAAADDEFNEDEEELILKYDAQHVIKIFKPVTVCLIFVIVFLSLITSYQKSDGQQLYQHFFSIITLKFCIK